VKAPRPIRPFSIRVHGSFCIFGFHHPKATWTNAVQPARISSKTWNSVNPLLTTGCAGVSPHWPNLSAFFTRQVGDMGPTALAAAAPSILASQ
jgi:hypothetical protein